MTSYESDRDKAADEYFESLSTAHASSAHEEGFKAGADFAHARAEKEIAELSEELQGNICTVCWEKMENGVPITQERPREERDKLRERCERLEKALYGFIRAGDNDAMWGNNWSELYMAARSALKETK